MKDVKGTDMVRQCNRIRFLLLSVGISPDLEVELEEIESREP